MFGASGSGTTTLGRELARLLEFEHHDIDDYVWEKTEPPYIKIRSNDERVALLRSLIKGEFVLSGCLREWGGIIDPMLSMAVFIQTPTEVRLARLKKRELNRYGNRILPGGDLYESHKEFLAYSATYDTGGMETRSAASQEAWAKTLACPVIRVSGMDDFRETALALKRRYEFCHFGRSRLHM